MNSASFCPICGTERTATNGGKVSSGRCRCSFCNYRFRDSKDLGQTVRVGRVRITIVGVAATIFLCAGVWRWNSVAKQVEFKPVVEQRPNRPAIRNPSSEVIPRSGREVLAESTNPNPRGEALNSTASPTVAKPTVKESKSKWSGIRKTHPIISAPTAPAVPLVPKPMPVAPRSLAVENLSPSPTPGFSGGSREGAKIVEPGKLASERPAPPDTPQKKPEVALYENVSQRPEATPDSGGRHFGDQKSSPSPQTTSANSSRSETNSWQRIGEQDSSRGIGKEDFRTKSTPGNDTASGWRHFGTGNGSDVKRPAQVPLDPNNRPIPRSPELDEFGTPKDAANGSHGRMIWVGKLERNRPLTIYGLAAGFGSVRGQPLPGRDVIVRLDPPQIRYRMSSDLKSITLVSPTNTNSVILYWYLKSPQSIR